MLLGVLLVGFLVVAGRLTELTVISPGRYQDFGASQRTLSHALAAERGTIYDRNGVELVMSRPSSSVFVDPQLIGDPAVEAAAVAPVLGLSVADVEAKMRGEGRFAYLARKVSDEQAAAVAALGLPGVALVDESRRYRPAEDVGQSILGTVDVDNVGLSGLELAFGDALTGTPGRVELERGPDGRTIATGDHHVVPAVPGQDVVLTIDRALQYETERILTEQVAATEAKGGTAVVSRPDTGEVLAMATVARAGEDGAGEISPSGSNAAVATAYEPGSVLKMVTVAAALEAGAVAPETYFDVPRSLQVSDAVFTDSEDHGMGSMTVADIFTHSSNIGTIKIAQAIGRHALHEMLLAFGFATQTALGLPDEQPGWLADPADWWDTSLPTVAIGHGMSVTPLQMLQAYNVVANGGVFVEPRLVLATVDADGTEHPTPQGAGHRVIAPDTADQLNVMLRDVVAEGTGQMASINGYTPAGKTGTSRKAQPNGTYLDADGVTQYQSTFVGFVPAEQPALSIIVVIDEPRGGDYTGGAVAAPAFSSIASFALRHLSIPPPRTDVARGTEVADAIAPTDAELASARTSTAGQVVARDDQGRVLGPRAQPTAPVSDLPASSAAEAGDGSRAG